MPFLRAKASGEKYELNQDPCVLGRHPECEVVIEAGAVSRRHASILWDDENFVIEDLKSRNKTFVNGAEIDDRQTLKHGDRIEVCDVVFVFHQHDGEVADDSESTGHAVFVEDDGQSSSSTIMSKFGVTSSRGQVQLTASPEAKLNALLEINKSLGRALALDQVLPQVLNSLFKIFVQADRGFIGLVGDDGVLVARWSKTRRDGAEDTIRVSRTIVSQVLETQEAILSADAATDERFEMSQSIADFRIRSMMCAPLINSNNESIGVLQIDTLDQRKRFQQEDLEVLVAVASQAGIAIDNAKMHDQALRQQAVERDLALAHEVQRGFLPSKCPKLDGYAFFDYYEPANHVGGDYFDYITLPDGKIAVIVADVVGHGVAAALLMAKLSAEARVSLASASQPAEAVTMLNNRLSEMQLDRFVTAIMAVLNPDTHEVTIVSAGHMAPVHRHVDGTVTEPGSDGSGLPLGIAEGFDYEQMSVTLEPGESMTMYTDGLNESAAPHDDEMFGIERIKQLVAESNGQPTSIGDAVVASVREFVGEGTQEDDMCLVTFGRV